MNPMPTEKVVILSLNSGPAAASRTYCVAEIKADV